MAGFQLPIWIDQRRLGVSLAPHTGLCFLNFNESAAEEGEASWKFLSHNQPRLTVG